MEPNKIASPQQILENKRKHLLTITDYNAIIEAMEEYANQWKDAYIAKDAQLETLKQKYDELLNQVAQLRQWKKEAMELLNPILDYGQRHPEIKLGASITEFVINKCKQYDELKAENARLKYGHELVTDALKNLQGNFNELKAENGELQQSFNQRGKVINNWKHSHARLEKEHTALKEKAEQVATILGALCATVRPILEGNNAEYLFLNAKTVLNSATEFISSYNSSTNNQTISKDE